MILTFFRGQILGRDYLKDATNLFQINLLDHAIFLPHHVLFPPETALSSFHRSLVYRGIRLISDNYILLGSLRSPLQVALSQLYSTTASYTHFISVFHTIFLQQRSAFWDGRHQKTVLVLTGLHLGFGNTTWLGAWLWWGFTVFWSSIQTAAFDTHKYYAISAYQEFRDLLC